jgi:putative transposase
VVRPAGKRVVVSHLVQAHGLSERRACRLADLNLSTWQYRARRQARSTLRERLKELAGERRRFGYRRLHALLRREGWRVNHKAVHRIYVEEGLQVRRRKRKRLARALRRPMLVPQAPNQRWSMDFQHDLLATGQRLRTLNIVDDFSRECPAIEVDTSLPGVRVVRVLERLAETRGLPKEIILDNGPEMIGKVLDQWPGATVSGSTSSTSASRPKTPSSKASTGDSAMNASTRTGSSISPMPARSSRLGGSTTTTAGRIRRSAMPHPRNLPHLTRGMPLVR